MKNATWVLFILFLDNDQGLHTINYFTWSYLQPNLFQKTKQTKKILAVFVQRTT